MPLPYALAHRLCVHRAIATEARPPRSPALSLATLTAAAVLVNIDASAVNLALATIQRDLHMTLSSTTWIVTAYMLALSCAMIVAGRLADIHGRKRIWLIGVGTFGASSLLCGLAQSDLWLIGARVLQGVGGALFFPVSFAIITVLFPGRQRATAIGIFAGVAALCQAIGPLVGGALTDTLGWRWIFFVNVPVAILSIVAGRRFLAESRDDETVGTIDWLGSALVTAGVAGLVFGINGGGDWGWTSIPVVASLGGGVALVAAFLAWQLRARHPLIDRSLLLNRGFLLASGVGATILSAMFAVLVYLPLFLQNADGMKPLLAGLAMLPMSIAWGALGPFSGKVALRLGVIRALTGGQIMMAVALVLLGMLASADEAYSILVVPLVLLGCGLSLSVTISISVTLGHAPLSKSGSAAGVNYMFRTLGGAVGIALATALFQAAEPAGLDKAQAFAEGFKLPMFVFAGIVIASACLTIWKLRNPDATEA